MRNLPGYAWPWRQADLSRRHHSPWSPADGGAEGRFGEVGSRPHQALVLTLRRQEIQEVLDLLISASSGYAQCLWPPL
jgi:hypothetical protein